MLIRIITFVSLFSAAILGLQGCGGAGIPLGNSIDQSVPHSYLLYKTTRLNDAGKQVITGLKAVRLDDLSNTRDIASSENGSLRIFGSGFQAGEFNSSEYSISSYHTRDIVYANQQRLFKVSVFQTLDPRPVELSSEQGADLICMADFRRANDYNDATNSRLVYKKVSDKSQLANCATTAGNWFMVKVTDTAGVAPVILPENVNYIIEAVHDVTSGALRGWLAVSGNTLVQYDTNFLNAKPIKLNGLSVTVSSNAWLMTRTSDKRMILNVDNRLYLYDPSDASYAINSGAIFSAQPGHKISSFYASDGEKLFFAVDTAFDVNDFPTETVLYALLHTDSSLVQLTVISSGLTSLALTDAMIVYGKGRHVEAIASPNAIETIAKSGGVPSVIRSPEATSTYNVYADGSYFYVVHWQVVDGKWKQLSLSRFYETDTSGQLFNYHKVSGIIYGHKLFPAKHYLDISAFVVIQSDPASGGKYIHVVDTVTGSMSVMGELDPDVYLDGGIDFVQTLGHNHVLMGIYHNGVKDLYYFDASVAGSLKRLTAGTSENESGVYYKTVKK